MGQCLGWVRDPRTIIERGDFQTRHGTNYWRPKIRYAPNCPAWCVIAICPACYATNLDVGYSHHFTSFHINPQDFGVKTVTVVTHHFWKYGDAALLEGPLGPLGQQRAMAMAAPGFEKVLDSLETFDLMQGDEVNGAGAWTVEKCRV